MVTEGIDSCLTGYLSTILPNDPTRFNSWVTGTLPLLLKFAFGEESSFRQRVVYGLQTSM